MSATVSPRSTALNTLGNGFLKAPCTFFFLPHPAHRIPDKLGFIGVKPALHFCFDKIFVYISKSDMHKNLQMDLVHT